jgi:hypothetical protein
MKVFLAVIGGIIVFALLAVGGTELGYRLDQHYQPREEQVRHDTFENSATKIDGDNRDMANMRLQYMSPNLTQEQKDAIRDTFQERYCSLEQDKISSELIPFWKQMGCGN